MFNSQALETAIGLSLMFFVLALASSTIVEVISRVLARRSKDLTKVLIAMVTGEAPMKPEHKKPASEPPVPPESNQKLADEWKAYDEEAEVRAAWEAWGELRDTGRIAGAFGATSAIKALQSAHSATKSRFTRWIARWDTARMKWYDPRRPLGRFMKQRDIPSYVSAKSFADAVTELIHNLDGKKLEGLPAGLKQRVEPLAAEVKGDILKFKAGLEHWFDESMARAEGAYKRWATARIFAVGLGLAVVSNAGVFDTAQSIWRDPVTRATVAEAASTVAQRPSGAECTDGETGDPKVPDVCEIKSAADTTSALKELGLPIGWDAGEWKSFTGGFPSKHGFAVILGWLATALLVMLGAPFWFDLLTKLVALRSTGKKPDAAADDPGSNTSQMNTLLVSGVRSVTAGRDPNASVDDQLTEMFGLREPATT